MAGQKQMLECTRCKMKSINSAIGDYEDRTMISKNGQRVPWSREKYDYYNAQPKKSAVHDWSRTRLNFEVDPRTGRIQEVDHNKPSLRDRWQAVMDQYYTATQTYKNPKNGKVTTKKRPVRSNEIKLVGTLMGGNRKRMHELAYDREVITGKIGIGRNGDVQRNPEIEEWAMDCYKWACKTWGKDNIVSFVVHLDETNPHIHCDYVPLVNGELSYTKMMHGRSGKAESSKHLKELHDSFAAEVGEKWGLERGDAISNSGAAWKSMEEHQREVTEVEDLRERLNDEINDITIRIWDSENREAELEESIRKKEQAERAINTKLVNLEKKLAEAKISEDEYAQKVAYHTDKLNAVIIELEKLRAEKEHLASETAQFPDLRKEVQDLQEQKQDAMEQVTRINLQIRQETAKFEAIKIGGLVHQSVSAFVRPAFFEDNQEGRSRRARFLDEVMWLAERQRMELMEFFVRLVAALIVHVSKEIGEDDYRHRFVRVYEKTSLNCINVDKPENMSAYPDYMLLADNLIDEIMRLLQRERKKEEERKAEQRRLALKKEAEDWIKGCSKSFVAWTFGQPALEKHFKNGTLGDFITALREVAREQGVDRKVEEYIKECVYKTAMAGVINSMER